MIDVSKDTRILALDIGSSSVRAGLFDAKGKLVSTVAKQAYETFTDKEGRSEVEPDVLVAHICKVLDDITSCCAGEKNIAAVSVSSFWHSLLALGADYEPLSPILTWADTRASAEAKRLTHVAGADSIRKLTGAPLHASFWPARLLWYERSQPELAGRTAYWVSACDYIFFKLLGAFSTSMSMASGTGLYDQNGRRYSTKALAHYNIAAEKLPPVMNGFRPPVQAQFASRWPVLDRVPWLGAFGDGACSNVGAGCVGRDYLVLMLGTSGSIRMVWEADHAGPPDEAAWCYRLDERRFASGLAMSEGGNVAAWANKTLNLGMSDGELERAVAATRPGEHRLTALPFVAGRRSPDWDASRTAALAGLRQGTSALDIYVALLESVALQFAALKRQFDRSQPGTRKIVATGSGFTQSEAWTSMVADALGEPVILSSVAETSLRGAALLALEALGCVPKLRDLRVPSAKVFEPREDRHLRYRELEERQTLFDGLMAQSPVWNGFASLPTRESN